MATLMLTFADLYGEAGLEIYDTRTPATTELTESKLIANRAYLRFIDNMDWTFLTPETSIVLWPTTTTTAVTVATTTLTVAAQTFYPSMVGHAIVATTSGTIYTITAVASGGLSCTVDAAATADNGDTFTITADGNYALPASCQEIIGEISYPSNTGRRSITGKSPDWIRQRRSAGPATSDPYYFAEEATEFVTATGQRRRLMVYPTTSTLRTMGIVYRVHPTTMVETGDFPIGGEKHAMTILACVRAECERRSGGTANSGVREQEYQQALAVSVERDNRNLAQSVGYNGNPATQQRYIDDRMNHVGGVSVS